MFDVPTCSPELARLYQIIGYGRRQTTDDVLLQLAAAPAASDEQPQVLLLIELGLEGYTVFVRIDEHALIRWIEPILSVPDLASLAVDLHPIAVTWALTPWLDWCAKNGLTPPVVKSVSGVASMLKNPDIMLSLTREGEDEGDGGLLRLYLDDFPTSWLNKMAQAMIADKHPNEQQVIVYGSVGFARLHLDEVTALKVGDVVMAIKEAPFNAGSLWIMLGRQLIQMRRMDEHEREHQFKVEWIMDQLNEEDIDGIGGIDDMTETDTGHLSDAEEDERAVSLQWGSKTAVTALPMTLVFEIGRMSVPLSALAQLSVGEVLEANFKTTPEIGIRTQGRLIATASLVRIGDRLGARITSLLTPPETEMPSVIYSESPETAQAQEAAADNLPTASEAIATAIDSANTINSE